MTHLDLFTGIGAFSLAAGWVWGKEHQIKSFCEIDGDLYKHLNFHWPTVQIHDDIKTLNAEKWRGAIDLVSGGVPCQPASISGKRRGEKDGRWLWPEVLRVVGECRPRWVLYENPDALATLNDGLAFERIIAALESMGYETQSFVIPACAVGAPHTRYRLWVVAHTDSLRLLSANHEWSRDSHDGKRNGKTKEQKWDNEQCECGADAAKVICHAEIERRERRSRETIQWQRTLLQKLERTTASWRRGWEISQPGVSRIYDGFADRFHEIRVTQKESDKRIAALGNAIVPQVAQVIFECMKFIDEVYKSSVKEICDEAGQAQSIPILTQEEIGMLAMAGK
jgi:DNA (cytosine-5)-methyltransferase 1